MTMKNKFKEHWFQIVVMLSVISIGVLIVVHAIQNPNCYSFNI